MQGFCQNYHLCSFFHHIIVFHKTLLLIEEHTLQQKKCGKGFLLMEFTGVTMFFTIWKQLGWNNGSTAFWRFGYSTKWQCLAKLVWGSPWGCICSDSESKIQCCSSVANIHEYRNQGEEMGAEPLLPIVNLLAQFMFPLPVTSCSAGLEALVPEWGWLTLGGKAMNCIKLKVKNHHPGTLSLWINR